MTKKEEGKTTHILKAKPGKFTVTGKVLRVPVKGKGLEKKRLEVVKVNNNLANHFIGKVTKKENANGEIFIPDEDLEALQKIFGEDFEEEEREIRNGKGQKVSTDATETHLFFTLLGMLAEKSKEKRNPRAEDFYTGQILTGTNLNLKGKEHSRPTPGIFVTWHELAKAYTGKSAPSGKEMHTVKRILERLGEKKFWIRSALLVGKNSGGELEYKTIAALLPLISWQQLEEKTARKKNGEMVEESRFLFQIDFHPSVLEYVTGYFDLPPSVIRELKDKNAVSMALFLYQAYSMNKERGYIELGEKLLHQYCFPEEAKRRKWKKIREKLEGYIRDFKQAGLLSDVQERQTEKGSVWRFSFNPKHREFFRPM